MSTLSPALRVLAAVRSGAHLAGRPRGVVHLYSGPLTRSGRFVPAAGLTVCRAATRRLTVVEPPLPSKAPDLGGRRFCRRCTAALPPSLGVAVQQPVSRDDWAAAYGHLTVDDLVLAARWTQSTGECHQVGLVASIVLGPQGKRPVDDAIKARRPKLVAAERTEQERAENHARRDAADAEHARIIRADREDRRRSRIHERRRHGGYLTPWERQLIAS